MKRDYTGNTDKSCQEKACEPLGDRPVGMHQIEFSLLGDPKGIGELGEYEKGQLHESHGAFLHVFQDPCTVAKPLKSVGVEIRKTKNLYSFQEFMPLAPIIMGGDNPEFDSELLQFLAEAENKYPGGISLDSRKGGCENKNSHDLPKR